MDPIDDVLLQLKARGPRLTRRGLDELQARLARQLAFLGQLTALCFPVAVRVDELGAESNRRAPRGRPRPRSASSSTSTATPDRAGSGNPASNKQRRARRLKGDTIAHQAPARVAGACTNHLGRRATAAARRLVGATIAAATPATNGTNGHMNEHATPPPRADSRSAACAAVANLD